MSRRFTAVVPYTAAQRHGLQELIVRFRRAARHISAMITIRERTAGSKIELVRLEATLKTPTGVYTISSEGAMSNSRSSVGGVLFGAISWPISRFRLPEGVLLEQQMFLPHDGSVVAACWSLLANTAIDAQLVVRPFFSGCGPRWYRDVGFHFESEEEGGRLTWLPDVGGPKVLADTNGRYHDEPVRSLSCFRDKAAGCGLEQDLVTPGRFEFQLGRRPSVLIFSIGGVANSRRDQHVGTFLAGLMQESSSATFGSALPESISAPTQQVIAA
jgi:hypothetical protein